MSKAHMDAFITQLQAIKMNATEKIMDFVNRIKALENNLAAVGYTVDSDEKRTILLRGVREEYSIPAQVIRSSGLEFDKDISDLILFEAEAEIREGRDFGDDGTSLSRTYVGPSVFFLVSLPVGANASGGGAFSGGGKYVMRSGLMRSTSWFRWITTVRSSVLSTRNGPSPGLSSLPVFYFPSLGSMYT